jgi:hypothetical protein
MPCDSWTRRLREYGWRDLTDVELRASVAYHRRLGTLMRIKDIRADRESFEESCWTTMKPCTSSATRAHASSPM